MLYKSGSCEAQTVENARTMQLQSAKFYAGVEKIYMLMLFDAGTIDVYTLQMSGLAVQALAKHVLSSFGKSISSALYVSGCFLAAMSDRLLHKFED